MENSIQHIINKPWGSELVLFETPLYRAKILKIAPGKSIHLQRHKEKDETMYIVSGHGWYLTDVHTFGEFQICAPGITIHIPPGHIHKIWASDNCELEIFEVSNGVSDEDVQHLEAE
jgi:mannose-6-phosphate isomerase-like protein (cupin superfamily)